MAMNRVVACFTSFTFRLYITPMYIEIYIHLLFTKDGSNYNLGPKSLKVVTD